MRGPIGTPRTFTVFIARRSGRRADFESLRYRERVKGQAIMRALRDLAETNVAGDEPLRLAQLALRRCLYLHEEMSRAKGAECRAMLARSIVETALVGAYLALAGPDADDRLMKKQSAPARRLRDRFLAGDDIAALALLVDVGFIADPLDPALIAKPAPALIDLAKWLDGHAPFAATGLATLLYEEAYSVLSNQVEHPTPQSLERHATVRRWARWRGRYRPTALAPKYTLVHVASPAIGGLAATVARRLGRDPAIFDAWAAEAAFADGYRWSGSPARHAAAGVLVDGVGLTRLGADLAGFLARMFATSDAFRDADEADQLVAASEILDRARRPARFAARVLLGPGWIRDRWLRRPTGDERTPDLVKTGTLPEDPQGLLAALMLVFAGMWPTSGAGVEAALNRVGASLTPDRVGALERLTAEGPDLPLALARIRRQVEMMT